MKKLESAMDLDSFRDEMQHRVVKYGYRSKPVKEAIRFAKQNDDSQFYQIAADKIHSQRQFDRQTFGPSRMEKIIDFLTLGSLREVFVMMLLVVAGVAGIEGIKSTYQAMNKNEQDIDIEELARKLNLGNEFTYLPTTKLPKSNDLQPVSVIENISNDSDFMDRLAAKIATQLIARQQNKTTSTSRNTDKKIQNKVDKTSKAISVLNPCCPNVTNVADLASSNNER